MRPLAAAALAAAVAVVCFVSLAPASATPATTVGPPTSTLTTTTAAPSSLQHTPTERSLLAATKPRGRGDLYALNDLTHHVVRFDLRQGKWETSLIGTGWGRPSALAVTKKGVAWVIDSTNKTLVRVASDGTQRTIATLSTAAADLVVADPAGNAYFNDGNKLSKVSVSGEVVTVLGSVSPTEGQPEPSGIGVDASGRMTVVYSGPNTTVNGLASNVVFATFPPAGGTPALRPVVASYPFGYCCISSVHEAPTGAITLEEFYGIGSGYTGLDRFAPGQSTPASLHGQAAFDSRGLLYVMDQRVNCLDPQVGDGSCVPDTTVDEAQVYPAAGGSAHGTIPITNLHEPSTTAAYANDYDSQLIAANTRGRLFAVDGPRLKTIPPGGGPAYTILQGQFFAIQTPPGT